MADNENGNFKIEEGISVNGQSMFGWLWRKMTNAAGKQSDANNWTAVNQTGESIRDHRAVNLDGDNNPEVIFDDDVFSHTMLYSEQLGNALKAGKPELLPQGHSLTKQQVHDIFYGSDAERQKALSENFNAVMKSSGIKFDSQTQHEIEELDDISKVQHISNSVGKIPLRQAEAVADALWFKVDEYVAKENKAPSQPLSYDIRPERTSELGSNATCRRLAPNGAAMYANVGINAICFTNEMGSGSNFGVSEHVAVYFPDTGNIAEFTSAPENTYRLNVFGNDLNGAGQSGAIYTINANDPSRPPTVYNPTQEAIVSPRYDKAINADVGTTILAEQIKEFGPEKLQARLMQRQSPKQGAPTGITRPELASPQKIERVKMERALEFAEGKHPEAAKLLRQQLSCEKEVLPLQSPANFKKEQQHEAEKPATKDQKNCR